jgi:hypothetical protein
MPSPSTSFAARFLARLGVGLPLPTSSSSVSSFRAWSRSGEENSLRVIGEANAIIISAAV